MKEVNINNLNQIASNINNLIEGLIKKRLYNNTFDKSRFLSIIRNGLLSEDKNIRKVSTKLVRRLKLNDFIDYIRFLLNDEDPTIRAVSILALAQMRDIQSFDKIKELYLKDINAVKIAALMYFGIIETKESKEILIDALKNGNEDLKENAFQGLTWHTKDQDFNLMKEFILKELSNPNLVAKFIKTLTVVNKIEVIPFLENLILKSDIPDNIILSAIYVLSLKNINKYLLLAESILIKYLKEIQDLSKHLYFYQITADNLWEIKKIPLNEQYKISEIINNYFSYYKENELKYVIRTIRNLNPIFHNLIIKIFNLEKLSIDLKGELINFLASKNIDKTLKVLLLEFLNDDDLYIRELTLFNLLSSNHIKSTLAYIEEYLYKYEELHLKLIILAILYLNS
jgi:hypothetical protein